jgi:hypothetical protein
MTPFKLKYDSLDYVACCWLSQRCSWLPWLAGGKNCLYSLRSSAPRRISNLDFKNYEPLLSDGASHPIIRQSVKFLNFFRFYLMKCGDNELSLRSQDQKFQNRYYQISPSDTILNHFSPSSGFTTHFSYFPPISNCLSVGRLSGQLFTQNAHALYTLCSKSSYLTQS